MKIQSVAILGAGAVGCYVLWGLADKAAANSLQLGVVAEGSRAERLRQNGCTINGQVYHPPVWTPQQAHGVDLLIVALKYGALPGALDSIRTIVSERTVVMSLMNGVDSEELISVIWQLRDSRIISNKPSTYWRKIIFLYLFRQTSQHPKIPFCFTQRRLQPPEVVPEAGI